MTCVAAIKSARCLAGISSADAERARPFDEYLPYTRKAPAGKIALLRYRALKVDSPKLKSLLERFQWPDAASVNIAKWVEATGAAEIPPPPEARAASVERPGR